MAVVPGGSAPGGLSLRLASSPTTEGKPAPPCASRRGSPAPPSDAARSASGVPAAMRTRARRRCARRGGSSRRCHDSDRRDLHPRQPARLLGQQRRSGNPVRATAVGGPASPQGGPVPQRTRSRWRALPADQCRLGKGRGQLFARRNLKLRVGVAEVFLDRLSGHEQLLGDLHVAETLCRQLCGSKLARGQRVQARSKDAPRPRTRRGQLLPGPALDSTGAAEVSEFDRPAKRLA